MKKFYLNMLGSLKSLHRQQSFCPVCGVQNARFLPLPDFYREHATRHGFIHFGKGEMTSLETYMCSNCTASDRERLYAWWLSRQIESLQLKRDIKCIHFAPEEALSKMIRNLNLFDYTTADLGMKNVDFVENIMSTSFEDESFDFFICSHVLEHVENDDRAIQELYRITKKGGSGILMAPIIVGLKSTIEDPTVTSEEGRWGMFGQYDHVRLYAHDDYVKKIRRRGFSIKEFGRDYFGANTFRCLGLKKTSILYVVEKQ